jgi:hypothetical protein
MQTEFQLYDRVQFDIGRLEDLLKALTLRVAALEAGTPLPPDQTIVPVPLPPVAVAVIEQQPTPLPTPALETELCIASGLTINPLNRPARKGF